MFPAMNQSHQKPVAGWLAAVGLVTGAGAVLAASCCVLPLVLGGLGAGAGLFSSLESLADYRTHPRFQRLSGSACVGRLFP